jgi:hypothetical protein
VPLQTSFLELSTHRDRLPSKFRSYVPCGTESSVPFSTDRKLGHPEVLHVGFLDTRHLLSTPLPGRPLRSADNDRISPSLSVRSEGASGLDRKPLALISAANATDNSLIWLFTLTYSSAYAWFGPFWIPAIIWGFIGIAHERAKGNLCPVSSVGVKKPRRSAAPHRAIMWTSIHSASQAGAFIGKPDNSDLEFSKPSRCSLYRGVTLSAMAFSSHANFFMLCCATILPSTRL